MLRPSLEISYKNCVQVHTPTHPLTHARARARTRTHTHAHKHTPSAAASDLLAVANTSDRRLEDASAACVWVWVCVGSAASVWVCVCLDEGESAYACHVRDVCRPSFASLARFFSLDASSVVKTEACFAPATVVRARLRWHDPARVSPDIAQYSSDPVDRPFIHTDRIFFPLRIKQDLDLSTH